MHVWRITCFFVKDYRIFKQIPLANPCGYGREHEAIGKYYK
jgi:hypothetical protein